MRVDTIKAECWEDIQICIQKFLIKTTNFLLVLDCIDNSTNCVRYFLCSIYIVLHFLNFAAIAAICGFAFRSHAAINWTSFLPLFLFLLSGFLKWLSQSIHGPFRSRFLLSQRNFFEL